MLLIVVVNSQILLQDRIEALRLAVRLGMESGRPVGVDAQEFQESAPKVRREDRIVCLPASREAGWRVERIAPRHLVLASIS